MKADEIYGTKNQTPHRVLLDTRFELPFGEIRESLTQLSSSGLYERHFPIISSTSSDHNGCMIIKSTFEFLVGVGQIKP